VPSARIVEAFDELEDGYARLGLRLEATPIEQLTFERGEAAPALVTLGLCGPVADRLCRRLKLLSQFLRRATGPNQLYHPPAEPRRIGRVFPCHLRLEKLKQSGVHTPPKPRTSWTLRELRWSDSIHARKRC
jgi:hypothetical protein